VGLGCVETLSFADKRIMNGAADRPTL
jgi:hypothetical protein